MDVPVKNEEETDKEKKKRKMGKNEDAAKWMDTEDSEGASSGSDSETEEDLPPPYTPYAA